MTSIRKFTCTALAAIGLCSASHAQVVISQLYGGGGNSGATYNQDFIELFNRGAAPVTMTNWSVQYQTQGASTWTLVSALNATIPAGGYYLISASTVGATGGALPTVDIVGAAVNLNANNAKVVVVNNTATALPSGCPVTGVVDLVGYGSTTIVCNEGGTNAPAPSASTSLHRASLGCTDTNLNGGAGGDFTTGAPAARNSATTVNNCSAPASGACCDTLGGCTTGLQTACVGSSVFQGADTTCDPNPCTATQGACCSNQGTCSLTTFAGCGGNSTFTALGTTCATANCPAQVGACCNAADGTCLVNYQFSCPGGYTFTALNTTCTPNNCPSPSGACCDGNTAGSTCAIALLSACPGNNFLGANTTCSPGICAPPAVVISQLYGGGGSSSTSPTPSFQQDFAELFNRGTSTVDIGGWTIQYASSGGSSIASRSSAIPAGTLLPAGQYYLIKLPQGTGPFTGADLTTQDFTSAAQVSMAAASGKVNLVRSAIEVSGSCGTGGAAVADVIGYGSADCFEGAAAAPALSTTTSAHRKLAGCQDTNQNGADFDTASPAPRNLATPANNCAAAATGGCCTTATGACSSQTQAVCEGTAGNTYLGNGVACNTTLCPVPPPTGGCCTTATGACSSQTQAACAGAAGNVYLGDNVACNTTLCPLPPQGVCCRGSTCTVDAGLQSQAACEASITGGALAGATFVAAGPCGGANHTAPCCHADYNQNGTRNVTDIFNFLTDWFGGRPWAIPGGNGTGTPAVGDIFTFLTDWFAAGCG